MHTVVRFPTFTAQAERAGLSEEDLEEIELFISENPMTGDVIPGTGGLRKVRFKRHGRGKSGGFRTIHFYAGDDIPVLLVALVDKTKTADLSKATKNEFRKRLPKLVADYRASVKEKVRQLRG